MCALCSLATLVKGHISTASTAVSAALLAGRNLLEIKVVCYTFIERPEDDTYSATPPSSGVQLPVDTLGARHCSGVLSSVFEGALLIKQSMWTDCINVRAGLRQISVESQQPAGQRCTSCVHDVPRDTRE